jgi:hypothetical protein
VSIAGGNRRSGEGHIVSMDAVHVNTLCWIERADTGGHQELIMGGGVGQCRFFVSNKA